MFGGADIRDILDTVPAYFMVLNADGRVVWVNRHMLKKLELKETDVIGSSPEYPPLNTPYKFKESFKKALKGKSTRGIINMKIGENERWFLCAHVPLVGKGNSGNGQKYVLVYLRDLSDHMLDIRERVNSEIKYRNLFENAPFGIIIFDKNGTVVDVNEQFIEIAKIKREEIIGRRISEVYEVDVSLKPLFTEEFPIINKKEVWVDKEITIYYSYTESGKVKLWGIEFINRPVKGILPEVPPEVKNNSFIKKIHLEISASHILRNNTLYGLQLFIRDITLRKNTEEKLKERERRIEHSRRKYKFLFENSPVPMIELDLTDFMEYINSSGLTREEILSRLDDPTDDTFWKELLMKIKGSYFNNTLVRFLELPGKKDIIKYAKVLTSENNRSFSVKLLKNLIKAPQSFEFESPFYTINDDIVFMKIKFNKLITSENRSIALISFIDITRQKQAEDILKIQMDLIMDIHNITRIEHGFVVIMDSCLKIPGLDSGFIYMSDTSKYRLIPTYTSGYSADFFNKLKEHADEHAKMLLGIIGNRKTVFLEEQKDRKFMLKLFMGESVKSAAILPIFSADEFMGIIVISSKTLRRIPMYTRTLLELLNKQLDEIIAKIKIIEKNIKYEEELSKSQRLESLALLSGGIAHDFNNIMTAIMGNITLAELAIDNPEELRERLEAAKIALQHSKNLTEQLLTFSKGGNLSKETANIKNLIVRSVDFLVRGHSVRPVYSFQSNLWPVEMDPTQIGQVLNNLVINAIQAMPNGGNLYITAKNIVISENSSLPLMPGKYVYVEIKDEGEGIPEENLNKIFDPYFTTKKNGSGLGLAISYSIIKRHDGYIGVNSRQGEGSVFYFYLPAAESEIRTAEEEEEIEYHGSGDLLIMDDNINVLQTLKDMLRSLGYNVETATNGREAVTQYKIRYELGKKFDLVILDLKVPGKMGGLETISELKKIDPSVKAIVTSGYFSDDTLSDYRKYGFIDVLKKPYRISDLIRVLKNAGL